MRRKKDNSNKKKIQIRIAKKILMICFILIIIAISLYIFITKNKTKDITYNENGNMDYDISILDNEFFKESVLSANNQYISSIIDKVNIKFKYGIDFNNLNLNNSCKYRIESQTKVIEKTTKNNLYTFNENLQNEKEEIIKDGKFNIEKSVSIDYQTYDAMVKKLLTTYELSNVDCKTEVILYIDLLDENGNIKNTSKMSVNIPLNAKTVNIETESSFSNSDVKIYEKGNTKNNIWIFLLIAVLLIVLEIRNIKDLINYIKRNCPKDILENIKLKIILSRYNEYIQKIENMFDMTGYTILRMESFEDLLKIREMAGQPILMAENETKTKVYFTTTTQNNMLYLYEINLGDIKELTN